MSFRRIVSLATVVMFFLAMYEKDLAAMYVVLVGAFVVMAVHAIEMKLNRLLDDREIVVTPAEIDKAW